MKVIYHAKHRRIVNDDKRKIPRIKRFTNPVIPLIKKRGRMPDEM